jgi:hypothetical protein
MLRRGFLTHRHPADGGETLWAPGCPEHPARFVVDPRPPRYGMHVPVVYDDAAPGIVTPLDPLIPVVPVIDWHGPVGVEVTAPSGLERLCPAPTVEEYRAAVDDGFTPPLSRHVKDPVLLALTLRMMQLSVFEAQRLCRLADAVTPELLDHVHRLGPGFEHSPEFADEALGNLPSAALGSHRRRVLHAVCVATMLARTTGPLTMFRRISADDLRTVLAPFVAVCGPVPGIDVDALRPPPVELPEPVPPPVIRARQLHDAVTGTLVWATFPIPPEVGQVVAVFTGTPTFGEVALGTACTHHRITVVNDVEPTGQTSVLVTPALPSTEGDLQVMPVDWCRTYLADNPSSAARPVAAERHPDIRSTSPRPVRQGGRRRLPWKRPDRAHVLLWDTALTEHDRIRERYLQYEMNPELILRYPAVTDVSVDQTAAFHDAAARADALRADAVPADPGHADAYHRAVNELSRRWTQCEDHGRRLGHTHLPTADATDLDRAVKLIRHAAGASTDLERATYLDRAQRLVDDISSRLTVRIGRTARRRLSSLASIPQLSPPSDADTL